MSETAHFKEQNVENFVRLFPNFSPDFIMGVAEQFEFDTQKTLFHLFEMSKDKAPSAKETEWTQEELRIIDVIKEGWKVVVLMRGLPGSGKTFLANKVLKASDIDHPPNEFILSTNDYFYNNGSYRYDGMKTEEAEDWNQERCNDVMTKGFSPIIIDNRNLTVKEMEPYCKMAVEFGYVIEILNPTTDWAKDPKILSQKNRHNISEDKIIKLMEEFDRQITPSSLLRKCWLNYKQKVPQRRLFPSLPKQYFNQTLDKRVGGSNWNLTSIHCLDNKVQEDKKNYEVKNVISKEEIKTGTKKELNQLKSTSNQPNVTPMKYKIVTPVKIIEPKKYVIGSENPLLRKKPIDDCDSRENIDSVQVTLGYELVAQLERQLGNKNSIDKNVSTAVQIPISLAKQLHAIYLQSLCQQIKEQQVLIREDEDTYKHTFQKSELIKKSNLSTGIDEQFVKFCQKKENESYKTMTPQTLVMMLKKNKLYESFPTVNNKMIDQLLTRHNYNYEKVVKALLLIVNQSYIVSIENLQENPIPDDVLNDMINNKAIVEQVKHIEGYYDSQQFRNDAIFYIQKVKHFQNLAQEYYKKNMGPIAVFYSKLAEDMQVKSNFFNQKARYMDFYTNSLKERKDMLDLHTLSVQEALTSLETFIEKWVTELDKPTDIFVIIYYGKHSAENLKLQSSVITKLKNRRIVFNVINPGLLRIKLHKNILILTPVKLQCSS